MKLFLYKDKKPYKYKIIVKNKTIRFGAAGYSDFTIHKDVERKKRYIERHKHNENWQDIKTKGFWSRWLLWNKPTIKESIRNIEKRFNVKITLISG